MTTRIGLAALPALAPMLLLAACGSPEGEDTADLAADATAAELGATDEDLAIDGAPDMASVEAAILAECPSVPAQVASATCVAEGLGGTFMCDYSFTTDPQNTQRTLTLTQAGEVWALEQEPAFCDSLSRANAQADDTADPVSVDTQPGD
jgi:hypothetical protein